MADKIKTFKISDLEEISISSISNDDSFLITDYYKDKGKDKYFTKRITMQKLFQVFANNPQLISALLADEQLDHEIQTKVDNEVEKALDISIINGGNATGNQ